MSARAEMPSIESGSHGERGSLLTLLFSEDFIMKVAFEIGPWRMYRILFLDWKEMRINIPQKAFSFQCPSLYVPSWKCQKLIREACDEGIGMNGSHANPLSDSLEICSPSASWCQQKCQQVSREKASLSSSFYRRVMPMREVLMRGGPCSRTNSFYGSTKWKNQQTKKSGYCAFWVQAMAAEASPNFTVMEGL